MANKVAGELLPGILWGFCMNWSINSVVTKFKDSNVSATNDDVLPVLSISELSENLKSFIILV